jgi:hypothetical protein
VRVGGDQPHPGQAACGQVAEERQPAGAVLSGGDLDTEDLPVPVGVHPGGDQGVHVDHPAALTNLKHQGVRGDERVRALVERPPAELPDLGVELGGHHRDLRLRQPRDPQGVDQLLHPPRRDTQQVAGRHHRGERAFGAAAALQQPVREVGALAQLRDRHIEGARSGVELPVPVAVAHVGAVRAGLAVGGAADRVGFGGHQGVHERGQHLPQQIR